MITSKKLRDWLSRYGPAEIGGLVLAFVASMTVRRLTRNAIASAYAAAWGETIGYASVIIVRDVITELRHHRRSATRHATTVATGLVTEFGPAGVIDTLLTRPFAMALGIRLFGTVLGLVVGKIMADVVFYAPVIYMYEWRKRRRRA